MYSNMNRRPQQAAGCVYSCVILP